MVRVEVNDNNVDQAVRALKKKLNRAGFFREMRNRRFFEKPSEYRRRKNIESYRRARKAEARRVAARG